MFEDVSFCYAMCGDIYIYSSINQPKGCDVERYFYAGYNISKSGHGWRLLLVGRRWGHVLFFRWDFGASKFWDTRVWCSSHALLIQSYLVLCVCCLRFQKVKGEEDHQCSGIRVSPTIQTTKTTRLSLVEMFTSKNADLSCGEGGKLQEMMNIRGFPYLMINTTISTRFWLKSIRQSEANVIRVGQFPWVCWLNLNFQWLTQFLKALFDDMLIWL